MENLVERVHDLLCYEMYKNEQRKLFEAWQNSCKKLLDESEAKIRDAKWNKPKREDVNSSSSWNPFAVAKAKKEAEDKYYLDLKQWEEEIQIAKECEKNIPKYLEYGLKIKEKRIDSIDAITSAEYDRLDILEGYRNVSGMSQIYYWLSGKGYKRARNIEEAYDLIHNYRNEKAKLNKLASIEELLQEVRDSQDDLAESLNDSIEQTKREMSTMLSNISVNTFNTSMDSLRSLNKLQEINSRFK